MLTTWSAAAAEAPIELIEGDDERPRDTEPAIADNRHPGMIAPRRRRKLAAGVFYDGRSRRSSSLFVVQRFGIVEQRVCLGGLDKVDRTDLVF